MNCPACGKRLRKILYMTGEYMCPNDNCPAKVSFAIYPEWYGNTQKEINKMWTPPIQKVDNKMEAEECQ